MDKAKWTEGQFGFHYLDLPGPFRLSVHWEKGGYMVAGFGTELRARFASIDEAKTTAVSWAKKKFERALEAL